MVQMTSWRALALATLLIAPAMAGADEMIPPFFDQTYGALPIDAPEATAPDASWQTPPPLWLMPSTIDAPMLAAADWTAPFAPDFSALASDARPPMADWRAELPAFLATSGADETAPVAASDLPPFFAETVAPPIGEWQASPPAFLMAQAEAPTPVATPDLPPFFAETMAPPVSEWMASPPAFLMAQAEAPTPVATPDLPPFFAETMAPPIGEWQASPPAFLTAQAEAPAPAPARPALPTFDMAALPTSPVGDATATPPAFLMAATPASAPATGGAAAPAAPAAARPSMSPGLPPFNSAAVATPPIPGLSQPACEIGVAYGRFHFRTGSARLDAAALQQISDVAKRLKQCPDLRIQVAGHTDNVGDDDKNMVLARSRALAIIRALERSGVEGRRLEWVSRGPSMPIASNDTPEGRALNRRIDVMVR